MTNEQVYVLMMGIINELQQIETAYRKDVPNRIEKVTYTLWRPKPECKEVNSYFIRNEDKEFFEQEEVHIPMPDIESYIESLKERAEELVK